MPIRPRSISLLLLLGLLFGLSSACSKNEPTVRLAPLASDAVILAFGDSITHGTGAERKLSYPAQLEQLIARQVVNAGVPGETTTGGLKRLPAVVKKTEPDLVILCLGGNDFLRRHEGAVTKRNLADMIQWLQTRDIPVMLMAVPQLGLGLVGDLEAAPMYKELGREHAVAVENSILGEVLSERSLKADPIHPNAAGYERIAQALQAFLIKHGAIAP